jgi:uncharacterized hydrophobic protein (TIGR00341 family)
VEFIEPNHFINIVTEKGVMKKVAVTARKEELEDIEPLLKDMYHFLEIQDNIIRITIYLHDQELDSLITKLENKIDLRCKESLIEVYSPDFIISSPLQRSEQRVEKSEKRIPVEKLIDSTKPHLKLDISNIALTSIAGMVALTGLFMDNIPVIIGAMLLSPLLGPIYAFAINTAIGRARDVIRSIGNLAVLLAMVILFSCIATVLISQVTEPSLTQEIRARMDSNFIYILMALLLGFASICALSRNISESIAGVAIAAALLPPAVVAGISLVLYRQEAIRPLVLTLENVLGLMAGSLAATLVLEIGPRRYYRKAAARKLFVRTGLVLVILLVLLSVFSIFL